MQEQRLRLKLKLIILLISVTGIALSMMGTINFNNTYQTVLRNKIQELTILRDLKADKIRDFFNHLKSDMHVVQDYYNIKNNLPILTQFFHDTSSLEYTQAENMLDNQLKTFLKERSFFDIMLVNPEGKAVYAINKSHGKDMLGKNLPDPGLKAFAEGRIDVYFSEIFDDQTTKKYLMLVTGPVYDFEGRFIGVIVFYVDMDPVYTLIRDTTGLGETGETVIARQEGNGALFLHPLKYDPEAALQRKVSYTDTQKKAMPMQWAIQGRSGAGLIVDYRGEPVIAAWQPLYVANQQWGLVTKIDQREVFSSLERLKDGFVLIFIITLILSIIIAFVNATTITQPLEKLTQAATLLSQGNRNTRVEGVHTKDEIGDLANAFNQMGEDLLKTTVSRDELTKEIQQRRKTEELLGMQRTAALNIMEDSMEAKKNIEAAQIQLQEKTKELEQSINELKRFNRAAVNREERMIELKGKINQLSEELGRAPLYDLSFLKTEKMNGGENE